jgi:CDP-paratose 2-epimerase
MDILITGICGFTGCTLAKGLAERLPGVRLHGIDNFIRPGSESNRRTLQSLGAKLVHGDIRNASDLETLPKVDWVIDAAANPSVLAGVDGRTSSRQLVEHNLGGTLHLLEFCRSHAAGLVLLSTSRVYSIPPLAQLTVREHAGAFTPDASAALPAGLSSAGVTEDFPTTAPVSLYGATKLASEVMALEYGATYNFPVWINRCGVMAGAGQFGRADQGIFAYWLNMWRARRPLKYIGFGGRGLQVRDCLHPLDLLELILVQMQRASEPGPRLHNVSGGAASARSLAQLSQWCEQRWGTGTVNADTTPRPFDIPWMVLDSTRARNRFGWSPQRSTDAILLEIAAHAEANPDWLAVSAPL